MITLLRLVGYPLRWLLALLVALPTSFALYKVIRPQSVADITSQLVQGAMEPLQRLATAMGAAVPTQLHEPTDWGWIILLVIGSFVVYVTILHEWRTLPFLCMLAIPVFEATRYYQPPIVYTVETVWSKWVLQLLTTPLLLSFILVVVAWRIFVYSRMLWRIGWRWTAGLAITALAGVAAARFLTPVRLIYDIGTSAHPGSVWLVTLMLVWGGLAWLTWKLRRKPTPQPAPAIKSEKKRITFEDAYQRVRARRG